MAPQELTQPGDTPSPSEPTNGDIYTLINKRLNTIEKMLIRLGDALDAIEGKLGGVQPKKPPQPVHVPAGLTDRTAGEINKAAAPKSDKSVLERVQQIDEQRRTGSKPKDG